MPLYCVDAPVLVASKLPKSPLDASDLSLT